MELIPNLIGSPAKIILTGLLQSDEDILIEKCKKLKMKVVQIKSMNEWIALEVKIE